MPRSKPARRALWLAMFMVLLELAQTVLAAPTDSFGVVVADGVSLPLPTNPAEALRVQSRTRILSVELAPKPAPGTQPFRYRFQLKGLDPGWRDPAGMMRFTVRFNDAKGNAISGEEFDVQGESPGWTGSPETSHFTPRQETLDVPVGATRLQIWLNSAGPQQTMGVYAIDALKVTLIPGDASRKPEVVEMIPRDGSLLHTSAGTPRGWARHGSSLNIAQILPTTAAPPLIVMRDDRPDAFGGWQSNEKSPALDGIVKVRIDWREAYSVGWGGSSRQTYRYLPAGDYRLCLQALSVNGRPIGAESSMRISVVPPFYEAAWFWISVASGIALLLTWIVRQITRQRMQRRLDALERERAVERERSRIARDLHDNLGADLTHLALLSDLAQTDVEDPAKAAKHLNQIFDLAHSLTRQVDEMVWAVNPANDSLKGFVPFLSNHAQNYLIAASIPCRLDIPAELPDAPLSSAQRHHLFLIVKEALHNLVKHAGATEAWLRIRIDERQFQILIEDNGCGITESATSGDGTINMQQRIAAIGGTMERTSTRAGTRIAITLLLVRPN